MPTEQLHTTCRPALALLSQAVLAINWFCGMRLSATTSCHSTPGPRQPKVADFEVARGIQQQVAGLEVTVQHVGCVHILETPKYLQRRHMRSVGQEMSHSTCDDMPMLQNHRTRHGMSQGKELWVWANHTVTHAARHTQHRRLHFVHEVIFVSCW